MTGTIEKEIENFLMKFEGSDPTFLASEIVKRWLAKKDVEIDKLKNCLSNKKCMHEDNFKSILDEKDAEIKRLRGSIKDLLEARKSEIERLEAELGKVLKDMAKLEDNINRSALRKINARQRAHERDINFAEERKFG